MLYAVNQNSAEVDPNPLKEVFLKLLCIGYGTE